MSKLKEINGATDGTPIGNVGDSLKVNIASIATGASPKDFLFEIQRGDYPKLSVVNMWGHNDAVKTVSD